MVRRESLVVICKVCRRQLANDEMLRTHLGRDDGGHIGLVLYIKLLIRQSIVKAICTLVLFLLRMT